MSNLVLPHTIDAGTEIVAAEHQANYEAIRDIINGNLAADNLVAALRTALGVNDTTIRRGKSIINTQETRDSAVSGTGYGLLATPDRVPSIVMPTDGLIAVFYQATWKNSVAAAGRASIFVGASQAVLADTSTALAPPVQEARSSLAAANRDMPLSSFGGGLVSQYPDSIVGSPVTDATTGQIVGQAKGEAGLANPATAVAAPWGGPCYIFAAAGTYDISVQFKASSGTVTAKNRKLWVMAVGF